LTAPSTVYLLNTNLAVHQTALTGDFSIMATAAATATSSNWNDFSIIFGYQNATNYYFANFSEGQDSASNGLFRVSNGRSRQITAFAAAIAAGTYESIRIERQGPWIRVLCRNALVASASDFYIHVWSVGFGSKNDAAKFDDLIVIGTPVPAPGSADATAPTITFRSPAIAARASAETRTSQ